MADKLNGIFISEILADNAGGAAIDTDGDGNTNKADEFIELQNSSGTTVSLDGFELWSEQDGLLFAFGATDTIAPGDTATVVGNYTGTVPAGYYDAGVSEGTNWLQDGEGNKNDTIFLVNTNTGEYITLSYGNPPQTPVLPTGFPGTTQVGPGETIDSNAPNGTAFARDSNGTLVETTPTPGTPDIPCFLNGTHIRAQHGYVPVEHLAPGDLVETKDHGPLPLRAIGRFQPCRRDLLRHPDLAPIRFPAGSFGNHRDMLVSASHRVLLESSLADMLFGEPQVLASASQCVGFHGIHIAPLSTRLVYYHLVFDRHEILCADGTWVESLFLPRHGLNPYEKPENWRVAKAFDIVGLNHSQTARRILRRFEAQLILPHLSLCPTDVVALAA